MKNINSIFKISFLFFIVSFVFLFVSCGAVGSKSNDGPTVLLDTKNTFSVAAQSNREGGVFAEQSALPSVENNSVPSTQNISRKLIRNGNALIEVKDIAQAEIEIKKWCASFGGYIESSSDNQNSASYTIKIPSVHFDNAMNMVGNFGNVLNSSISQEDVTEQFYDIETRLNTKKIMRERLTKYLEDAKDIKEIMEIERELNQTISEIEAMEGKFKRLSNQIDFSTINIDLRLPYRTNKNGFIWPNFGKMARRFVSNVADYFGNFVFVLLYIVIFGIPIVAVLLLLYWLLFGKVGILKKIFKKLK